MRRLTSLESQRVAHVRVICVLDPSRFLYAYYHFAAPIGIQFIPWSHAANELPSIIRICTFSQPSMPSLPFGAPQGWPSARPEEDIGGQKGNVPPEVSNAKSPCRSKLEKKQTKSHSVYLTSTRLIGGWKDSEWTQICTKDWSFVQRSQGTST